MEYGINCVSDPTACADTTCFPLTATADTTIHSDYFILDDTTKVTVRGDKVSLTGYTDLIFRDVRADSVCNMGVGATKDLMFGTVESLPALEPVLYVYGTLDPTGRGRGLSVKDTDAVLRRHRIIDIKEEGR